jgi:hypothetical protein
MNTQSPSSTPQVSPKVGSEITAQPAPHLEDVASVDSASVRSGISANSGLVHVLKAEPLVTETPAIGDRAIHHLEAGSNLKPPQSQQPTPQQDAAGVVLARIYPEGNVPSRHTGTIIYNRFKTEWDRDPERMTMKRPSKATVLRKLKKKKY